MRFGIFGNGQLSTAIAQHVVLALLTLVVNQAAVADDDYEEWTARFQTTYVRQVKPPMHAAYSGTNSLQAEKEFSYTGTATAFLGIRPWQGGELYLNPEITQGVPV